MNEARVTPEGIRIHAREDFRHVSFLSPIADAVIAGAGAQGYLYAVDLLLTRYGRGADA